MKRYIVEEQDKSEEKGKVVERTVRERNRETHLKKRKEWKVNARERGAFQTFHTLWIKL